MKKFIETQMLKVSAVAVLAMVSGAEDALAQGTSGGGNDFGDIAKNITGSISDVPGLLTGLAYMLGILLGVLGILKIKDHVENPSSEKLSHGAIRLAAGGGLFALPIVYEAMQSTVGNDGTGATQRGLDGVQFNVN